MILFNTLLTHIISCSLCSCVEQLTVNGRRGVLTDPVPSRVGVELKEEAEHVPIRRQDISEKVVPDLPSLPEVVTHTSVRVSVKTSSRSTSCDLYVLL
jgi:hypothetical protein